MRHHLRRSGIASAPQGALPYLQHDQAATQPLRDGILSKAYSPIVDDSQNEAEPYGLRVSCSGSQFQDGCFAEAWSFNQVTPSLVTRGYIQTLDLSFGSDGLERTYRTNHRCDTYLSWEAESSSSYSIPILSEGSDSHSGFDSFASSFSRRSNSTTDTSPEPHNPRISTELARVDSLGLGDQGVSCDLDIWPYNDFPFDKDQSLNGLMDMLDEPSKTPSGIPADLPKVERLEVSTPDMAIPSHITPCPENDPDTPFQVHAASCGVVMDDMKYQSMWAHDRGPGQSASDSNDNTALRSSCISPGQSTVQQDGVTGHCLLSSRCSSSQDVTLSMNDTDSHSDYEWSTETNTSVSDEVLRHCTSVRQQDPQAYLRYLEAVLKLAFIRFATWSGNGHRSRPNESRQQPRRPPPTAAVGTGSTSQHPSKKRKRETRRKTGATTEEKEEEEEEEDDDLRGDKKVKLGAADDEGLIFACPYFRLDPRKHSKCMKHILRRIRDVKQHLVRHHLRPHYCPVCGLIFTTEAEQEVHVEERSCERPLNFRKPDGITQDHRAKLSPKSGRNLSPEEQWFGVWDIIFPGIDRPDSAYISGPFTEVTDECEAFWTENGRSVFAEWLATAEIPQDGPNDSELLFTLFLDCSRHFFQSFRSQYARTVSLVAQPADRLAATAQPSSQGSTYFAGESSTEPTQVSFGPHTGSQGELMPSRHNTAFTSGSSIPSPFMSTTEHELQNGALIDDELINEQALSPSLVPMRDGGLEQSALGSGLTTSFQENPNLDDSYLFPYMNLEGSEFDAAMLAYDTRLNELGKNNSSGGNIIETDP